MFFIAFSCGMKVYSQVITVVGQYKAVDIVTSGCTDNTKGLILLHEIYNVTTIVNNYAIGTITAMRGGKGSSVRLNVIQVNTESAYNSTFGSVKKFDSSGNWALKTCFYNSKKYLAVDIPYSNSCFDNGLKFCGWVSSTSESMKFVPYEVNGAPVNQALIGNIQDFAPNMSESLKAASFNISGNISIGTSNAQEYKLAVAGPMMAESVKVKLQGTWPDDVFKPAYHLMPLSELKFYLKANRHLLEFPSAGEVGIDGLNLGEINKLLTKKVEELTLYLIGQVR